MPEIKVEVVFALAEKQRLTAVTLQSGATVSDAITASSVADCFPKQDLAVLDVGVWGRAVTRGHVLADGDRVEIYRPLTLDPREARRQLALTGQTMSGNSKN